MQKKYVVSACLAGVHCRYDGKNNAYQNVMDLVSQGRAILVCPEQLGGMATPRMPSEIVMPREQDKPNGQDWQSGHNGARRQVIQKNGQSDGQNNGGNCADAPQYADVTDAFYRGAEEALAIAKLAGCTHAVLKARSPSCGCGVIYDGSFSKKSVAGNGIFAQAALDAGINVWTEENWKPEDNWNPEENEQKGTGYTKD